MGLSIDDNTYESVSECVKCKDILFDGATPAKVAADFTGIIACPGRFPPTSEPNQTFILPQVGPCKWQVFESGYQVVWTLEFATARLFIQSGLGFWFFSDSLNVCDDEFSNDLPCVNPNAWSGTGTGKVYWGPQIGKGPIS